MNMEINDPDFIKQGGLVPAIIQHYLTGEVLMLGYMNEEAYQATRKTGWVHFYSRSRSRLWKKGEESGNTLLLIDLRTDCDADAILVRVVPRGPVCHTGTRTCFTDRTDGSFLFELVQIIRDRKNDHPKSSYTAKLFDKGVRKMAQKLGEEATETVIEAVRGNKGKLLEESADLLYHLLVLLEGSSCTLEEVIAVLAERHRELSGKASGQ